MGPEGTARKSAPMGTRPREGVDRIADMRTRAVPVPGPQAAVRAPAAVPQAPGPSTAPASSSIDATVMTPGSLVGLQATAGNRATVQALSARANAPITIQRAVDAQQADAIAKRLHDAMAGWGTDEEAVYGALSGRTTADIDAIREAYLRNYDHTLQSEIDDEFSGSELARANALLRGQAAPGATATADEQQAATANRARDIAVHLKEAMAGWGTEEDEIFNALTGREPDGDPAPSSGSTSR